MSIAQHQHGNYCTLIFNTAEDLEKALDHIMYETKEGFSMIDPNIIVITNDQCKYLESFKEKEHINYILKN